MARRTADYYKPPFFMIRYIKQVEKIVSKQLTEQRIIKISGKNSSSGNFEVGLTNVPNKTNSIKSDDPNKNLDLKNTNNWDKTAYIDKSKYAIGWAVIRNGVKTGQPGYENTANSLLPGNNTTPHILCKKPIALAKKAALERQSTNDEGVEYVYPVSGQGSTTPISTAINYSNGDVRKYVKDAGNNTTTLVNGNWVAYPGNGDYQIVTLKQSAATLPTGYVVIKYFYEDKNTISENTVDVVTKRASGDDNNGTPAISVADNDTKVINVNVTTIDRTVDSNKTEKYTLDLYSVATYSNNNKRFGFGIEKFDLAGDSRKSVQQTRGLIDVKDFASTNTDSSIDNIQNNFYIDTWWKGPETIVLSGVIELPHAYEAVVSTFTNQSGKTTDYKSFYDVMEEFFLWNNNPLRVSRGDKLQFVDYYMDARDTNIATDKLNPTKTSVYDVSFKNRRYSQSVDRPGLILFEYNFIVLGRSK